MIKYNIIFYKSFFKNWPCSSVVEQYPEKVCVVSAILTRPPPAINTHRNLKKNLLKFYMVKNIGLFWVKDDLAKKKPSTN